MKWFRFYDEVLHDPKCQRLPPLLFKQWISILCLANRSDDRGTLPNVADIAFALRVSETKAMHIVSALVAAGLLDRNVTGSLQPHNWNGRQRQSDDVAERVKSHRMKQDCNVTEVLPVTPRKLSRATDTDTDTDTESGANAPPPSASAARPPGDVYALVDAFALGKGLDTSDITGKSRRDAYNAFAHSPKWVTPEAVNGCTSYLMTDPFWQQPAKLKAHVVVEALPEWRRNDYPSSVPASRPQANSRASPGSAAGPGIADANGFMLRRKDGGYTPEGMAAMARAEEQEGRP